MTTPHYISPLDAPFNAVADYVSPSRPGTDNTRAWQAAIDAWKADEHAILLLPPGRSRIDGTLDFFEIRGRVVQGHGTEATSIFTTGDDATRDVFAIRSCSELHFSDFGLRLSTRRSGICQGTIASYGGDNIFTNVSIRENAGAGGDGYLYGFLWDGSGRYRDANNDINALYSCSVANYRIAGYCIAHSQSKHHRFVNCLFSGGWPANGGEARRGVLHAGVLLHGGSFRWTNGGGGSNAGADFVLLKAFDNLEIRGADSENSNRFVMIGGGSTQTDASAAGPPTVAALASKLAVGSIGAPFAVSIANCRFAANDGAPDGALITVQQPGPVTITGNALQSPDRMPHIYLSALRPVMLTVTDNVFSTPVGAALSTSPDGIVQPFSGYVDVVCIERNIFDAIGLGVPEYAAVPPNGAPFFPQQSGVFYTANTARALLERIGLPVTGKRVTIVALDDFLVVKHDAGDAGAILLDNASDFAMQSGDVLELIATARLPVAHANPRSVWQETGRTRQARERRVVVAPSTTSQDIAQLEYDLGGVASLVNIWDRRFGVRASGGGVEAWDDARGASRGVTAVQANAGARLRFDVGSTNVRIAHRQIGYAVAPGVEPLGPSSVFAVVYRNIVDPLEDPYMAFDMKPDGTFVNGIIFSSGLWPRAASAPHGDVAYVAQKRLSETRLYATAGTGTYGETAASSTDSAPLLVRPLDTVIGSSRAAHAHAVDIRAVLRVRTSDYSGAVAAIKAWAAVHHLD